jgi:tRNA A-37 threonylcarbamoyl transferase component Bud32
MNSPERNFEPPFKVSDYEDEMYYHLLRKLPTELARNHMQYATAEAMTDEEIVSYLSEIVSSRQEAITNSEISDTEIKARFEHSSEKLFRALETTVFTRTDNYLGAGMTAKVKLYEVAADEANGMPAVDMAIKYVVTPTAKTLTAEQEHNVIKEVERMRIIEQAEKAFPKRSKYIRVPHPFLYHQTDRIQLYGMERIDGITLEEALRDGMLHQEFKEALQNSQLASVSISELEGYIDRFFQTMHEYCLHGDIKPRNIMISRDGVFYIIDFGQSVSSHNIPEKAADAFENLKEDETEQAKTIIKMVLAKIFSKV